MYKLCIYLQYKVSAALLCTDIELHSIHTSVPQKVMANTVTVANLRRSINSTHVMQPVSWDKPQSAEEIINYVVEYQKTEEGRWYNHIVNNASIVLVLPLPQSNTTYSLRVAAVSDAGQGTFSEETTFSYTSECSELINSYSCTHYNRSSRNNDVKSASLSLHVHCSMQHRETMG